MRDARTRLRCPPGPPARGQRPRRGAAGKGLWHPDSPKPPSSETPVAVPTQLPWDTGGSAGDAGDWERFCRVPQLRFGGWDWGESTKPLCSQLSLFFPSTAPLFCPHKQPGPVRNRAAKAGLNAWGVRLFRCIRTESCMHAHI